MSYDAPDLTPFKKAKFKSLQPLYKIENLLKDKPKIKGVLRKIKGSSRYPQNKHQLSNCTTTIKHSKSKHHAQSSIISIEDEKQVIFFLALLLDFSEHQKMPNGRHAIHRKPEVFKPIYWVKGAKAP